MNGEERNEVKTIMDNMIEASAKAHLKTSGSDIERFINDMATNFNNKD